MDMFDFAGLLFGGSRTAPDATTVTATGAGASEDGEVGITLDADVTPAEDTGVDGETDQTVIDLPTSPDVDEGDELIVTLVGDGPLKTPVVTANPGSGDRMRALANSAKAIADAAQAVADAVNQHFFSDTNGIHVTEVTQEEWNESHTGANVLINSIGQLFRDGLNNLLTLTTENGARALTIWDGLGNTADNIRAIIGETIQLGNRSSGNYLTLDDTGLEIYNDTVPDTFAAKIGPAIVRLLGDTLNIETGIGGGTESTFFDSTISHTVRKVSFIRLRTMVGRYTGSKTSIFTASADQIETIAANGDNAYSTPAGTVLWSSSGWAMAANVTATLDYPVTSCPSGIVLHWQAYASGSAQNYAHVYTFVPKQHVVANAGGGVTCQLAHSAFSQVGTKYVYVNDGSIAGNAANTQSGTANGITYNNGYWVLTQVISA